MPPASELSITANILTAATSLANSSDGDESGYDEVEYVVPTCKRCFIYFVQVDMQRNIAGSNQLLR